jgi:hypothetical protein
MIFFDSIIILLLSTIHISIIYRFELKMYTLFKNEWVGSENIGFWEFNFKYLNEYNFYKKFSDKIFVKPATVLLLWGSLYPLFIPILVHNYVYKLDMLPIHPTYLLFLAFIFAVFIIPYILYKKEIKSKKNTDSEISN